MKKLVIIILCLSLVSEALYAQAGRASGDGKAFVLGQIEQIESLVLAEKRTLNIYLPEGYKTNDSLTYPVVYLLDGSADEDFIHVVGLYQYNNFSWIDRVPKSIIVGIANVDRKRDFTFATSIEEEQKKYPTTGKSGKFITFMEQELQPYIQKKYKTNSSKTLIGESLGGLLATQILFEKPELFNQYIIISPSIWWDNGSLLRRQPTILSAAYPLPTKVYIDVGKEGLAPCKTPHVMELDANLLYDKLKAGENKSLKVYFDYLPEEDHATVTHQAIFNALRLLNPKAPK